jgi:thiamine pyrophosphokinase
MRVFIVAGSPRAERPAGLTPRPGDRVIAADSGAIHAAAWGWPVHLLVGDLDSAPPAIVAALIAAGAPTVTAPTAKDETDLELALARALEDLTGLRDLSDLEIILCAALGGRADHALANVLLLARPELAEVDVRIVEGGQTIQLLRGAITHENRADRIRGFSRSSGRPEKPAEASSPEERAVTHLALTGTRGDLLSLLPIGGDAVGVTTAGLAYPLRDETLYFGRARGVSNVFVGEAAEVWLREGMMLVVQMQDEKRKTKDERRTESVSNPNERGAT